MSSSCRHSSMSEWRHFTFFHSGAVLSVFTQEQSDDQIGIKLEGNVKGNIAVIELFVSVDGTVDGSMWPSCVSDCKPSRFQG